MTARRPSNFKVLVLVVENTTWLCWRLSTIVVLLHLPLYCFRKKKVSKDPATFVVESRVLIKKHTHKRHNNTQTLRHSRHSLEQLHRRSYCYQTLHRPEERLRCQAVSCSRSTIGFPRHHEMPTPLYSVHGLGLAVEHAEMGLVEATSNRATILAMKAAWEITNVPFSSSYLKVHPIYHCSLPRLSIGKHVLSAAHSKLHSFAGPVTITSLHVPQSSSLLAHYLQHASTWVCQTLFEPNYFSVDVGIRFQA